MFCSPTGKRLGASADAVADGKRAGAGPGSCLSSAALMRIVDAYNATQPARGPHRISKAGGKASMWAAINKRMSATCGDAAEHCWIEAIPGAKAGGEVEKLFVPPAPKSWKKDEYTWLTNFDIEKVMKLYDHSVEPSLKYQFLGVFPIDFARTTFGGCLYQEMCNIDFAKMLRSGVQFMGAILNTDPQDAPGQHWISLFMVIDPALPSYGAYFFDSVGDAPPKEVKDFMYSTRAGAAAKLSPKRFRLAFSKKRMQYRNTECGVFSIAYQLRWLNMLAKNKKVDFKEIVDQDIDDAVIHELRKVLFRPTI